MKYFVCLIVIGTLIGLTYKDLILIYHHPTLLKNILRKIDGFRLRTNIMFSLLILIILALLVLLIGSVSHLNVMFRIVLGFIILYATVLIFIWMSVFVIQHTEFVELTSFLQHLIVNFRVHKKFYSAICETSDTANYMFKKYLTSIITSLESGEELNATMRKFCEKYNHFIVINLFRTFEAFDTYGMQQEGDSFHILEEDIDDWIEDTFNFKYEFVKTRNQLLLASGLSLLIFMIAKNMLFKIVDLANFELYQYSTFTYFSVLVITILYAFRVMRTPWISEKERVEL